MTWTAEDGVSGIDTVKLWYKLGDGDWQQPTELNEAGNSGVNAGDTLQYTIVLANSGDHKGDATLSDPIPAQTTYKENSAQDCSYSTWAYLDDVRVEIKP